MQERKKTVDVNCGTVTVITPCYNHGHVLRRAVDSVLNQTYDNITMVIVDDASTDDSYITAEEMFTEVKNTWEDDHGTVLVGKIEHLPAILVGFNENRKQAAARNKAIELSWNFTDYYCQLDADDEYFENKIEECVDTIRKDKSIGLVYNDVIISNDITNIETYEFRNSYDRRKLEFDNIISNAPLFKKEAIEIVGLYDEQLPPCEDWDMWLRITEYFMAIHIPKFLQKYHITQQSCTFTVDNSIWNKKRQIVLEKLNDRKKNG